MLTTGLLRTIVAGMLAAALGGCASSQQPSAVSVPITGRVLYTAPNSVATQVLRGLPGNGNAVVPAALGYIASQPVADWLGDWVPADKVGAVARQAAQPAYEVGKVAVIAIYAIPDRDCKGFSAGGLATSDAYRSWLTALAHGISGLGPIVILEPDSLAQLDCLTVAQQSDRLLALNQAVDLLTGVGARVYLDGGHAGWQSPAVMAQRLRAAGVDRASGFALNVSNFDSTAAETAYGHAISAILGGAHFVIDTSRSGRGAPPSAALNWCNPQGRGLGQAPTTITRDPLVDAYLWVKTPGVSDGACRPGDPPAGRFWPAYAVGLYQRRTA
ncbi:MAG TPA: glycoside hydrolase family 6 protein [Candidatus Nanopelagicales bacterium]